MKIGEYILAQGDITLNQDRATLKLAVQNTGDRPVQIGSHYHFYEVNDGLHFDRQSSLGYRLNIPAGTATRFEPGQTRTVELVQIAGLHTIYGFQARVMGVVSPLHESQAAIHTVKAKD